jgi:hypothetical protein
VPNWLCGRAATHEDFMDGGGTGVIDFGRFLTGFFVVMGIGGSLLFERSFERTSDYRVALPAMFSHCGLISPAAMVMSIVGGLLIYGTIISFTMFFQEEQEF